MNKNSIIDTIMFRIESIFSFFFFIFSFLFISLPYLAYNKKCLIIRDYPIKEIINYSVKIWVLKLVHKFAIAHDALNRVVVLKYLFFLSFSIIFALSYDFNNQTNSTNEAIRNGFFIAPLVTLMFTQQAKIIEIFLSVFNTKLICTKCVTNMNDPTSETSNDKISLDVYSVQVQNGLYIAARNRRDFTKKEKEIWKIFDITRKYANSNRNNYERENTQALLIAAALLFIGYMYFIQDMVVAATTLLIFAFVILLNRLALGIRTVVKFYLIGELAINLANYSERKTKNGFNSAISEAIETVKQTV